MTVTVTGTGHSWAVAAGPADGPIAQLLARCAEATVLLDGNGTVVYAAGSVEALLGLDPAAVLGRPLRDLAAEPGRVDGVIAPGRVEEPGVAWRHGRGRVVALDTVADSLPGAGHVVTVRDRATAAAVDAVRRAVAAGRAPVLTGDLPLVVFVLDERGGCAVIGGRWHDLTGQDEAAARGVGWLRVVVDDDRAALRGVAGRAHAQRRAWRHQFRLVRGDGRVAWVDAAAEPVQGPGGDFAGYVGVVAEVTADVLAGGPVTTTT